jgi:ELWxxDGT repeat protein
MQKKKRRLHRNGWHSGRLSKTVRSANSRRALIESLELRQLLTSSAPVLVPSPFTYSSNPTSLLTIGDITYFAADDGIHGNELWKTDGTAAGTMLVKDIEPGSDDGIDSYRPEFANVNGTLFFAADVRTQGYELWKSDGTAAGTVMVAGITPRKLWLQPQFQFDQRQRHAVLHCRRRCPRQRALEKRWHRRRYRHGY